MMKSVLHRLGFWLVPLVVLLVSSCASTGVSKQKSQPLQIPQHVPVADITQLVANSLSQLHYAVVEMNPSAGTVRAVRYVPNDIWSRYTRFHVDVATGYMGGKMLNIEAFSCPGCIPQATYDPEYMINEFNANFDAWLRGAGLYGQQQYPAQSGQTYVAPTQQAAPAWTAPSSSPPPAMPPGQQPSALPALRINSMEISPGAVTAGSPFDVVTDYVVFDPAVQDRELPVQFSLSILQDGKVLFSPKAVEIKSPNKGGFKRVEHMNASKDRGRYTVRATIRYKDVTAEKTAAFEIR